MHCTPLGTRRPELSVPFALRAAVAAVTIQRDGFRAQLAKAHSLCADLAAQHRQVCTAANCTPLPTSTPACEKDRLPMPARALRPTQSPGAKDVLNALLPILAAEDLQATPQGSPTGSSFGGTSPEGSPEGCRVENGCVRAERGFRVEGFRVDGEMETGAGVWHAVPVKSDWSSSNDPRCSFSSPPASPPTSAERRRPNDADVFVPDEEEEGPVTQGDLLMAGKLRRSSRRLSRDNGYEAGVGS